MSDASGPTASADVGEEGFVAFLNQMFQDVDEQAFERHVQGAEKYGPFKFLGVDSLEEALEEVLDLVNYARYTAVKIKLLQRYMSQVASGLEDQATTGEFVSMSQWMEKEFKKP